MDQYLKKIERLKSGERSSSVVRSRSASVEPPKRTPVENKEEESQPVSVVRSNSVVNRKVAYQKDIEVLGHCIESLRNSISDVKSSIEQNNQDLRSKIDDVVKQLENVKQDTEQTKSERIKQKLDSFINNYNQNEASHSDILKGIENEIKELNKRLESVEEVL